MAYTRETGANGTTFRKSLLSNGLQVEPNDGDYSRLRLEVRSLLLALFLIHALISGRNNAE